MSSAAFPALRARQRHRELDARRRLRTAALLQRLEALSQATIPRLAVDAAAGRKKEKADILQSAADALELAELEVSRLQLALAQLAQQQAQSPSAASSPFSSSPSSPLLSFLPAAPSLSSSAFLPSAAAMCAVDVETGCYLDANSRFLQDSGWALQDLVGLTAMPPFRCLAEYTERDAVPHFCPRERLRPWVRDSRSAAPLPVPGSASADSWDEDDQLRRCDWIRQPRSPQYPATRQRTRELLLGGGETGACLLLCRSVQADGRLYEEERLVWLVERQHERRVQGQDEPHPHCPPRSLVFMACSDRRLQLD